MTNQTEIILALTETELSERDNLDRVMDSNEDSFITYIRALREYRDKRLYRTLYNSFDAYLSERRKKFSRQRVSQLIRHVEVVDAIAEKIIILPESERQTRELIALKDPTEQAVAWLNAQKASGEDQPDSTWVKGSVEVIEQAKITGGYVDVGNGKLSAMSAATIQSVSDAKQRQRDHINQKTKRKPPLAVFELVFANRGEDSTTKDYVTIRIPGLTEEIWNKICTGEVLRGVFYQVIDENQSSIR